MAGYKPKTPFSTAIYLLIPQYSVVSGVEKKTFPTLAEGVRLNCSFRTFGGTDQTVNGLYSILDTAEIETWYRSDIKAGCRIGVAETSAIFEIIGEPEDIEMRHQYCKFKIKRVRGGA